MMNKKKSFKINIEETVVSKITENQNVIPGNLVFFLVFEGVQFVCLVIHGYFVLEYNNVVWVKFQ